MTAVLKALSACMRRISPGLHRSFSFMRDGRKRAKLSSKVQGMTDGMVAHGPFKGLNYITGSRGSVFPAKLVGSYEEEIHQWIDEEDARYVVDEKRPAGQVWLRLLRSG